MYLSNLGDCCSPVKRKAVFFLSFLYIYLFRFGDRCSPLNGRPLFFQIILYMYPSWFGDRRSPIKRKAAVLPLPFPAWGPLFPVKRKAAVLPYTFSGSGTAVSHHKEGCCPDQDTSIETPHTHVALGTAVPPCSNALGSLTSYKWCDTVGVVVPFSLLPSTLIDPG